MQKILIVEDNADLLRILSELLSRDFDVTATRSGEEALERIEGVQPDAVILDMQLPGMNGMEAGKQIKTRLAPRQVPVLALTALAGREEEAKALSCGCCDCYMKKPAPLLVIKKRLEEMLEGAQKH